MVRHDDVLERGHLLEDGRLLECPHHALAGHGMRLEPADPLAVEQDLAVGRRQERGDQLEQRALAGAVRADHREDLAVRDLEADVVDRDQAAEALGQMLDAEQAHRSAPIRSRTSLPRLRMPLGRNSITAIISTP